MSKSIEFSRTVLGAGSPVALAHGMGGSIAAHYGNILDGLAEHHTVIGVDYPGSGTTPRAKEPLSLDILADGLVHSVVEAGYQKFPIIGFSLGAPVAIRAATRHPDHVTGLVLCGGFHYHDNYMILATELSSAALEIDPALFGKLATLFSLSPATIAQMPMDLVRGAIEASVGGLSPGTPEQADLFARADVREDLAKIQVPTLVVATTEDRVVPVGLQRSMASEIKNARIVELDSGHLLFAERPEEWLEKVNEFLRDAA